MKRPFQLLGRGGPVRAAKAPMVKRPFRSAPLQITGPLPICDYCQKTGHTQQECRRANGLCLACGSGDHTIEGSPHKRTGMMNQTLPASPVTIGQRNPGLVVKRNPLPPQQQVFRPAPRGGRTTTGRGRGRAYNLTTEEAQTSGEVVTGKIMVHSKPVLALFDSGASHCYISDSFALSLIHI